MKLEDRFFSKEHRYWLGVETESGTHYAAIPVANQMVDYIEWYRISDAEYVSFLANPSAASTIAATTANLRSAGHRAPAG